MIYITGDTHGNIDFNKLKIYFKNRYVTKKDYLFILGDVAIVWNEIENYIWDYIRLGLTILFIDGNHENFELLNKFPVVEFKGAKCHRIAKDIYHVLRGEIVKINDLSFFCMGGATSIDKYMRQDRISWWEEENITYQDIQNGLDNLEKVNNKVDYVLTHCAPSSIVKKMFGYQTDPNTDILEKFKGLIDFKYWYFGHYHENKKRDKFRCFYQDILEIPSMYKGKKNVKEKLYTLSSGFDDYKYFPYLINRETGRKTSLKAEDLPEWYFEEFSYRFWYYCLKDVTDVAFHSPYFDNHISKDSRIYLHYHGKLKKKRDFSPVNEEEWDCSTWRCSITHFCLGLKKYSPHLNLKPLKARINLVYDNYNNGDNSDAVVRPFPEIKTPHYKSRYSYRGKAQYVVLNGNIILSEFIDLDRAIEYAKEVITEKYRAKILLETSGDEQEEFIKAFDYDEKELKRVFVKRINY